MRYTMTDDELGALRNAARRTGVFTGGVLAGFDPARAASEKLWKEMGEKYGFKWRTVRGSGGDPKTFEAEAGGGE